VWQRSSRCRVDIFFLLAIASLRRVWYRSSRVAVASLRLLGAAAAIHFSAVLFFFEFSTYCQHKKQADGCS
jgi:hypothetical protein